MFGLGLIVSGMANPAKVLGFLDLAGAWDPSLALVMGGAVGVGAVAFFAARQRTASLLGAEMKLPAALQIDRRLVGGSLLFGIGWGVAGFCPGPALVALGMGEFKALLSSLRCWPAWRGSSCSRGSSAAGKPPCRALPEAGPRRQNTQRSLSVSTVPALSAANCTAAPAPLPSAS